MLHALARMAAWHACPQIAWFDHPERSSGALSSVLSTDASHVRGAVGDVVGLMLQNLVTLATGYFIALFFDWRMALLVTGALRWPRGVVHMAQAPWRARACGLQPVGAAQCVQRRSGRAPWRRQPGWLSGGRACMRVCLSAPAGILPLLVFAQVVQTKYMMGTSGAGDKLHGEANQSASESMTAIRAVSSYNMQPAVQDTYGRLLVRARARVGCVCASFVCTHGHEGLPGMKA